MKNTGGILEKAEKGLQAIRADSWPRHGVMGVQVNRLFRVVVAQNLHLFANLNLIDK